MVLGTNGRFILNIMDFCEGAEFCNHLRNTESLLWGTTLPLINRLRNRLQLLLHVTLLLPVKSRFLIAISLWLENIAQRDFIVVMMWDSNAKPPVSPPANYFIFHTNLESKFWIYPNLDNTLTGNRIHFWDYMEMQQWFLLRVSSKRNHCRW